MSVQPEGEAARCGHAVVDFRVPNESDKASTVKLEVSFPRDTPLASALPEAVPGWTAKVTKAKLDKPIDLHGQEINEAVSKITWTAAGKGVQPGFFQKFPVSIGTLPEDSDELAFKTVQSYSDGEVSRWIEVRQEEPDDPAPVLTLSEASEGGHHGSAASAEPSDDASPAAATTTADDSDSDSDSDSSDTTARVLGVVGIVVGAIGVSYGVLAGRRRTNA